MSVMIVRLVKYGTSMHDVWWFSGPDRKEVCAARDYALITCSYVLFRVSPTKQNPIARGWRCQDRSRRGWHLWQWCTQLRSFLLLATEATFHIGWKQDLSTSTTHTTSKDATQYAMLNAVTQHYPTSHRATQHWSNTNSQSWGFVAVCALLQTPSTDTMRSQSFKVLWTCQVEPSVRKCQCLLICSREKGV